MSYHLDDVQLVLLSFRRATISEPFYIAFYEHLEQDAFIAEVLAPWPMPRRHQAVRHAVACMIMYRRQYSMAHLRIQDVVDSHGPNGFGLEAAHMEWFVDTLIHTVERFDDRFDDLLRERWKRTLEPALSAVCRALRKAA